MATKDSTTVDHWHTLLRDVAQLKPTDLLIGATSWDDIEFSGRSVANGTIEDRRRFYWTTRMFSLGEGGPAVFANWNNFAGRSYIPGDNSGESHNVNKTDPDEATAAHDWFDFARARGATTLW